MAPGAVVAEGVLQLEQAPRDAARFDKIATQALWPERAMHRLDPAACSERLGEPTTRGGLMMGQALAVRSDTILEPWLAGAERVTGRAAALEATTDGWRVKGDDGAVLIEADAVVLTAGWGSARLAPDLPLSPGPSALAERRDRAGWRGARCSYWVPGVADGQDGGLRPG